MNPSEQSNERLVIGALTAIALGALVGVVFLAKTAAKTKIGVDTAVIVALIGVIAQCASSLGTRRTRPESPALDATQPPPYVPPLEFRP